MTPEAKQLIKDKPELCKEIAKAFNIECMSRQFDPYDETWKDFLKEHTKPDWEILSFRSGGCFPFVLKENGKYGTGQDAKTGIIEIEHLLYGSTSVEDGILSIHSVRRSDGEVFEVGDKVRDSLTDTLTNNAIQEISAFMHGFCPNGTEYLTVSFKSGTTAGIGSLTKLKPLFKTEDGIDVYPSDGYAIVSRDDFSIVLTTASGMGDYREKLLRFSTREAAEAWVEDHKPRYSIADLKARGLHI